MNAIELREALESVRQEAGLVYKGRHVYKWC